MILRESQIERCEDGRIGCDVCPVPATTVRPATKSRELAFYCSDCTKRSLDSWGDTFRDLTDEDQERDWSEMCS